MTKTRTVTLFVLSVALAVVLDKCVTNGPVNMTRDEAVRQFGVEDEYSGWQQNSPVEPPPRPVIGW